MSSHSCSPRFRWGEEKWEKEKGKVLASIESAICALLSSSYNLRLGGTQEGWTGEMSVPITSAFGKSSAKSLTRHVSHCLCAEVGGKDGVVHGP